MEDDAADQLHVERAHPEGADGRFADDGEGFLEQLVERCGAGGFELLFVHAFQGLGEASLEFRGLGAELVVGEGVNRRLEPLIFRTRGISFLMSRSCWVPKTFARTRSII